MQVVRGSSCLARQVLSVGAGSISSQAFGGDTKGVRIWTDTKMAFRFGIAGGAQPVALPTDEGMSAGQTEYFVVQPGEFFAVISIP